MSIIRPDQFNPPHKGNSQRASQGLGRFYMSAPGVNQGEIPTTPSFTPLVVQDYSNTAVGSIPAEGWLHSEIVDTPAFSGSRSARLGRNMAIGDPVTSCGGQNFGKYIDTITVTEGHTIWQRYRMYIPSTFSWAYAYQGPPESSPDSAEAGDCGNSPDGNGYLKFLVFAPDSSTARSYFIFQAPQRRNAAKSNITKISATTEASSAVNFQDGDLPEDQWFTIEQAVKVSKNGDGYVRVWVNDQLISELTGRDTITAQDTGINKWGIGNYWNGIPWSDGAAGREYFYINDIIVATDMDGYGAPPTKDSLGNPHISSEYIVEDF